MADSNPIDNVVGLQIGGTVGPNDIVGVHVAMPRTTGIGMKIDVNDIDTEVRKTLQGIPNDHPKADELKSLAKEILNELDGQAKLKKVLIFIQLAAGIATIAGNIDKIKSLIGQ